MNEKEKKELIGVLAQAYCTDKNSGKVVDSDLLVAIHDKVITIVERAERDILNKAKLELELVIGLHKSDIKQARIEGARELADRLDKTDGIITMLTVKTRLAELSKEKGEK